MNEIIHGLFEDHIHNIPDQSVDLVVTSPPYAEQRINQYGGILESEYPDWTVKWMDQVKRVLKPNGNVLINIRPHVENGQLSDYTLLTRLALRKNGWNECDELIWIKPDSPPVGSINRPRRSWESIHWFSLSEKPVCNPKSTGILSKRIGLQSKKGVTAGYINGISDVEDGIARSPDFFQIGSSSVDKSEFNTHPAQYPVELVEWMIKIFSPLNGVVLDPFIGSGSTAVAAIRTDRSYIGFEKESQYVDIARKRAIDQLVETNEMKSFIVILGNQE